jgi:ankyrin repeat protein
VKYLCEILSRTSEVLAQEDHNGHTGLHFAAMFGHANVVRTLTAADPQLLLRKDSEGMTAVHYAAFMGHLQVVRTLDPLHLASSLTSCGATSLHIATAAGCVEMVKLLGQMCPQLYLVPDVNGMSCLHYAALKGHVGIAKLLLQACPDLLYMRDDKNQTCVRYAANHVMLATLEVLGTTSSPSPAAAESVLESFMSRSSRGEVDDGVSRRGASHPSKRRLTSSGAVVSSDREDSP